MKKTEIRWSVYCFSVYLKVLCVLLLLTGMFSILRLKSIQWKKHLRLKITWKRLEQWPREIPKSCILELTWNMSLCRVSGPNLFHRERKCHFWCNNLQGTRHNPNNTHPENAQNNLEIVSFLWLFSSFANTLYYYAIYIYIIYNYI